jgi:hypothetical protein
MDLPPHADRPFTSPSRFLISIDFKPYPMFTLSRD